MLLINNFPSFKVKQNISFPMFKYYTGGNIGHCWIADAIRTILPIKEGISNIYYDELIMHHNNSHIIVNAQDWIKPQMDYGEAHLFVKKLKNFILKYKKPVILLGLGLNNYNEKQKFGEFKKSIDKDLIDLLYVISDHCDLISVRGEFTHDFLNLIGIKNSYVTGCPTMLLKKEINIDYQFKSNAKLAINCGYVNRNIKNKSYFVQDEDLLLNIFLEKNFDENVAELYKKMSLEWFEQLLNLYKTKNLYLMPNFFSAIRKYKEFDLTVGSRLHGGIASLCADVPTIVTNPDVRAKETTSAMGIPYFPELCNFKTGYFGQQHDINKIFESIDWNEVSKKHKVYKSNFVYFFNKNKICIEDSLKKKIKNKIRSYEKIFYL